ncbi:MAG: N-acetylneuraminate synthase family protein [Chloroflexi bacterium]|nr:N-acetylneuraminate synthase family protein [Chloroflexota bacterium]
MILGNCDLEQKRLLIAELGNNHEGDQALAMDMVTAAAESGADAVKVQIIDPEHLVHRSQTERIAQLSRFRLPLATLVEMATLARKQGMLFIASAFDVQSLKSIADHLAAIKIASGDLDFEPLLIQAAKLDKPIFLSTGMSTLDEITTAVNTIAKHLPTKRPLKDTLALLHCVSLYPVPLAQANLRAINTLHETFDLTVGYSDHVLGIQASVTALALGARVIEKHFTLDKSRMTFRDHALSADPTDLRQLSDVVHSFDEMLGTGEKKLTDAELQMAQAARRSIVAARDLDAGTRLTFDDLDYVRPRKGLSPTLATSLIGRILKVPVKRHDLILETSLE